MNVAPQRVVTFHYVLSDAQGQTLDDSRARNKPLEYLHGHGNIMAGLEDALLDKTTGDTLSVTLSPAQAYGVRDESLVRDVSRDAFPNDNLQAGMRFQTPGDDGPEIVTVLEARPDSVRIDTNHPLAGQSLTYEVTLLDIRDATRAELAKGHPLPPGTTAEEVEDKKMV